MEEQQAQLALDGYVDPVLDEVIDDFEQEEVQLQEEMAAYEPYVAERGDDEKMKSYTMKPLRHLQGQLDAYVVHKTKKLAFNRATSAVEDVTAESDVGAILRFMGWLKNSEGQQVISCLSMLRKVKPDVMEAYCEFLIERPVCYGSVANYMNGVYNVLTYAKQIPHQGRDSSSDNETTGEDDDTLTELTEATFNLRKQADQQAKVQKMYKPRKPNCELRCAESVSFFGRDQLARGKADSAECDSSPRDTAEEAVSREGQSSP